MTETESPLFDILYVGDLHGKVEIVAKIDEFAAKNNIKHIVQVGDFGVRFPTYLFKSDGFRLYPVNRKHTECKIFHYFTKRKRKNRKGPTWYTCGGNHDNWNKWADIKRRRDWSLNGTNFVTPKVEIAPDCFWIPRGGIISINGISHCFFGGAESIDKASRTEGIDWWERESPTIEEFNILCDQINNEKPKIIITHDCPDQIVFDHPKYQNRSKFSTPKNLGNLIQHGLQYIPEKWFFGHHHTLEHHSLKTENKETIDFYGCGYHGQCWGLKIAEQKLSSFNILSKKEFEKVNWNNMNYE